MTSCARCYAEIPIGEEHTCPLLPSSPTGIVMTDEEPKAFRHTLTGGACAGCHHDAGPDGTYCDGCGNAVCTRCVHRTLDGWEFCPSCQGRQ